MSERFNYHEQKEKQDRLPSLGSIVWWQLKNIHIERTKLAELFDQHGFKEFLPTKTSPQVAIKRAINQAMVEAGATRKGLLIRNILTDPGEIVYGVVAEKKDRQEKSLDYNTLNKITVFPDDDGFGIEFENQTWPYGQIEDTYQEFMKYHNADDL